MVYISKNNVLGKLGINPFLKKVEEMLYKDNFSAETINEFSINLHRKYLIVCSNKLGPVQ